MFGRGEGWHLKPATEEKRGRKLSTEATFTLSVGF